MWLNTFYIFVVLCIVNFLFLKYLFKGYSIEIVNQYRKKYSFHHDVICSVFYTGFIFFGLKMSTDKFNLKHWGSVLLVVFQFTVGLVCLAFLFNSIIN